LPGLSGLDLQRELARMSNPVPIIFITGHGDIPMTVKAMKAGAVDSWRSHFDTRICSTRSPTPRTRPMRPQAEKRAGGAAPPSRVLTPREREVMAFLVKGMLNKQVAAELAMTEPTVKFHRAHVMQKMMANSMAELARMAEKLIEPVTEAGPPRPVARSISTSRRESWTNSQLIRPCMAAYAALRAGR